MVKCKKCGVEVNVIKGMRKQIILLDREGYQHKDVCRQTNRRKLSEWLSLKTAERERKDSRSEAE